MVNNQIDSLDQVEDDSYRLCYVQTGFTAYFAQGAFKNLIRDGWHKIPYEHNATAPYGEYEDIPVISIQFMGDFELPCDKELNSPYSVNDITMEKELPWLKYPREGDPEDSVRIYAGTSLPEFVEKVQKAGGDVLIPLSVIQDE